MTTRPRLATDVNYRNGVGALLLFAVLAWTFLTAGFDIPQGFSEGGMTRSIGFAMFDMLDQIPAAHGETEGFLVAFIVVAFVLDAALDGAVMLARREEGGSVVTAIADGGRLLGRGDTTDDATADATDGGRPDGASPDRSGEGLTRDGRDAGDDTTGTGGATDPAEGGDA